MRTVWVPALLGWPLEERWKYYHSSMASGFHLLVDVLCKGLEFICTPWSDIPREWWKFPMKLQYISQNRDLAEMSRVGFSQKPQRFCVQQKIWIWVRSCHSIKVKPVWRLVSWLVLSAKDFRINLKSYLFWGGSLCQGLLVFVLLVAETAELWSRKWSISEVLRVWWSLWVSQRETGRIHRWPERIDGNWICWGRR